MLKKFCASAKRMDGVLIKSLGAFVLASILCVDPALAGNEDIVVTARKRAEGTQDVPVTISAVSAETIEKYKLNDPAQLVGRVPGLQISQAGSGSSGSVRIRGIGNSSISAAFDTAVALNIDGVQSNMARILRVPLLDMRQIEVLKGPQALYFGKGASAGVMTLNSADPTDTFEAKLSGSREFEEKGWRTEAYVSGPITDTLKGRIAGSWMKIDQIVESDLAGGQWVVGGFSGVGTVVPGFPSYLAPVPVPGGRHMDKGQKTWDVRATLQWDPTDALSAKLKVFHQNYKDDGYGALEEVYCAGGASTPSPTTYPIPGLPVGQDHDCNIYDGKTQNVGQNPGNHRKVPGHADGLPYGENKLTIASLQTAWELNENLTLSSTTGWLKNDADDGDSNGSSNTGGQGEWGALNKREAWSEELRLQSDTGGMFDFMGGGYWQHQDIVFQTNQLISNTVLLLGPDPVTGNDWDYQKRHKTKTDAYSFFGNLTFRPIENVQIDGGLRWSHEKHKQSLTIPYMHSVLAANGLLPAGSTISGIKFKDSNVSPEATILWKATPNVNLYGAYKTGFKSGGLDNSVLPFAGLTQQTMQNAVEFGSEEAKGFEVGAKTDWLDRTVRLNLTAYRYVISDLQLQEFDTTLFQFNTRNAGEVTAKGLEVESVWQTPLTGLALSAGGLYSDSKYTKDFIVTGEPFNDPALSPENQKGRQIQGNSKYSGYFAADYDTPLAGTGLMLSLGGTATYRGRFNTGIHSGMPEQKGFWKYDGVISLSPEQESWKLSLIGRNIGNKRTIESGIACRPQATPGATCDYLVEMSRARQILLEASYKF